MPLTGPPRWPTRKRSSGSSPARATAALLPPVRATSDAQRLRSSRACSWRSSTALPHPDSAATARNVPTAATDNCADIASRYEADLFSSVTARSRSLLTRGSMVWGPKFTDGVAASLEIPEVL